MRNFILQNFLAIQYTHVYVAGIDVVTLTVIMTRNRSQGYTVVIVCIKKMKHQPIKSLCVTGGSIELYFDFYNRVDHHQKKTY